MEYNLASLRREVALDLLDDEEYDSGIIDRAINRTLQEIYTQFELTFMEKIFSGTVPEGYTIFKYPADLSFPQRHVITSPDGSARCIDPTYIPYDRFVNLFPNPVNSTPSGITYWTSYGGNIMLSQPADKDYTLDVYYIKKPAKLLADTDVPELPEEFGELLALGAYIRIAKRNEDLDLANVAVQEYAGKLNKLVDRYGFRKAGPIKMKSQRIAK